VLGYKLGLKVQIRCRKGREGKGRKEKDKLDAQIRCRKGREGRKKGQIRCRSTN